MILPITARFGGLINGLRLFYRFGAVLTVLLEKGICHLADTGLSYKKFKIFNFLI